LTKTNTYTPRHVFTLTAGTLALFMLLEAVIPAGAGKWRLLLLECAVAVPLLGLMLLRHWEGRDYLRWRRVPAFSLVGGAVVGLGLSPVFDEVNRLFQMLVPMDATIRAGLMEAMQVQGVTEWVVIILASVIVAGLAEETLFRGFIQSVFESYGDVTKAVLVTAFLFTVLHFNPWWFIEILIMGVLFGAMACETGSIFPSAVAHGVYNLSGVLLLNLSPFHGYEKGVHVAPQWILLGLGLAVAGFRLIGHVQKSIKDVE